MDKLPFSPLLNDGKTLVQPVYANDVGRALMLMVYVSIYWFCYLFITYLVNIEVNLFI